MLSDAVVSQVQGLLADGLSAREVASAVGVSRGSVHNIAQRRPPEKPERTEPRTLSQPIRCPGCGAKLIIVPCIECAARNRSRR